MFIKNVHGVGLVAGLGAAGVMGCASSAPPRTAAETASAWEQAECAPFREDGTITDILNGRAVERVEPLYTGVLSRSTSPRLEGAVLTVQPIKGATAEWLERSLECHSIGRMLGRTVATGSAVDPFVLPGSLLRIHVHSSGDGFRVELVGATMVEAREVLSRADTFAGHDTGRAMATDLSAQ